MVKRILTAVIAIPLGVLVILLDYMPLYVAFFSAVSLISVYELLIASKYTGNKLLSVVSIVFAAATPTIFIIPVLHKHLVWLFSTFVLFLFIILLFKHDRIQFEQLSLCAFISIAIPLAYSSFLFLRETFPQHGQFLMLFILITTWMADAGAYFVGTFIGKHPFAPKISPKKTWEGFIGGIVIGTLSGVATAFVYLLIDTQLNGHATFEINIPYICVISAVMTILAVVGDLSASIIKRQCSVKDFGNLMPGHGGVLDRFDSVLFVAPFVYQLFSFFSPFTQI
ncbi:MAG: phosphatidate cytidylyltransferase [Oscillospiraceae bacterium]|jgi:phosphatidate cytidylyltransferase|nr:phosphatidate cytidylyltransferase [Oscillospiraceae bacterium]